MRRLQLVFPREHLERLFSENPELNQSTSYLELTGLIQYAVELARFSDFQTIQNHVSHDLVATMVVADRKEFTRRLHTTMDLIGLVASLLIPLIEQWVGTCDPTVCFERFIGEDLVLSVPYPFDSPKPEGLPRGHSTDPTFYSRARSGPGA